MLVNDRYTYRIVWSGEDGEYIGLCAEFPSLSWLDPSPEEALKGIRQVVAEVVADLQMNNEPVPEPLRRNNSAVNSWCGSPRNCIASSPSKRRKPG
jgi:predicted RNase H-like HicB family nuclease